MIIKKVDKKKDRQLILQHKQKLLQQLQETVEPALVLHLASLILFTTVTSCIIHASGKFVAQILAFIRPHLSNEQNEQLMQYHGELMQFFFYIHIYTILKHSLFTDYVLKLLQAKEDSDEAKLISEQLQNLQNVIKELAACYEKTGTSKTE